MGNINGRVIAPFKLGTHKRPKLTDISQKTRRAWQPFADEFIPVISENHDAIWEVSGRRTKPMWQGKVEKTQWVMMNMGENNRYDEIRKRFISKNWPEVNGHPCEKWANGWCNDRTGNVQYSVEAVTGRVTGVKSCYKLTKFSQKITWK